MLKISVIASWNAEHKVWTASSEDVAGLHVQTDTYEELLNIVPSLVEELLTLNDGSLSSEIPLEISSHYKSYVHLGQQ